MAQSEMPAKEMKVSGAMPNPPKQLAIELAEELKKTEYCI
jgi:hypothetical protein